MTGKEIHKLIKSLIEKFNCPELLNSEEDFKDYSLQELAVIIFDNMDKDEKNIPKIEYGGFTSEIKLKNKKGKNVMKILLGWDSEEMEDFSKSTWKNIIRVGKIKFCEGCGMFKTSEKWQKYVKDNWITLCDECDDKYDN